MLFRPDYRANSSNVVVMNETIASTGIRKQVQSQRREGRMLKKLKLAVQVNHIPAKKLIRLYFLAIFLKTVNRKVSDG
jgi:hypothetical protein